MARDTSKHVLDVNTDILDIPVAETEQEVIPTVDELVVEAEETFEPTVDIEQRIDDSRYGFKALVKRHDR